MYRPLSGAGQKRSSKSKSRGRAQEPRRQFKLNIAELLESRVLLTASAWTNPVDRFDVANTGQIAPLDALIIINDLNKNGAHSLASGYTGAVAPAASTSSTSTTYEDVNGDGAVSSIDALMVINQLNAAAAGDQMEIRLEVTDLSGNAITSIQAGQQFQLEAFVSDITGNATPGSGSGKNKVNPTGGVYASYPDITLSSPNIVSVDPNADVTYGSAYQNVEQGDLSEGGTNNGTLLDVGATATTTIPVGPGEFLLFSFPITATSAGTETFTPSVDSNDFYANLLFGQNAAIPASEIDLEPASITITSTTSTPSISIGDITQAAPTSGSTNFAFPVTLSAASTSTVTVVYNTSNGTASSPGDYTSETGTLTFAAGSTSQNITVPVAGTTTFQPSETFNVTLTSPTNATLADGSAIGTITNTNVAPTLAINSVSINRPSSGMANEVFTVTLSGLTKDTTTVAFATADGTAKAGTDYNSTTGTLTFAPGISAENITVPVIGSSTASGTETYVVNLTNPSNATITTAQGTGTIVSTATSTASINNVSGAEPSTGSTPFVFTVTLSAASSQAVTVTYATSDVTATSGVDYTAASSTLTFSPGTTTQQVTVNVLGSTAYSPTETFDVKLTGATNGAVSSTMGTGVGTITNTLSAPTLAVSSPSVVRSTSTTTNAVFTVTLTGSTKVAATVNYATANATAVAGTDYTSETGVLTFAPGTTTENVTVPVLASSTVSGPLTFTLNLTNPVNAQPATLQGTATIISQSAFSINDVTQDAGTTGSNFVFTVSLGIASSSTQTVTYTTADGSAKAGTDYTAESGTLTFSPGTVTQNITVPVSGVTAFQPSETFTVNLTNSGSTPIVKASGTGTITNTVAAPTLSVANASVTKATSSTTNEVFTVTLTGATNAVATVAYTTVDGSAKAGTDYTAESGTLTFAVGTTTQNVTVPVLGNSTIENPLTFTLSLTNPVNAQPSTVAATGTILSPPAFAIADVTQNPGTSGTSNFVFPVTLTSPSSTTQTVVYATANGTAIAGTDYTSESGTLTFAAGTTSQNITVPVLGTSAFQPSETFTVNLSNATEPILDGSATGTITNTNAAPTLAINSQTISKPAGSSTNAVFTVTLTGASKETTTVAYATANGTGTAGTQYTAESGTLTFAPGATTANITVPVIGNPTSGTSATFQVNLSSPGNATITTATGTGTIVVIPGISIGNVQQFVGNSSSTATNFVFTVTLSNATANTVTVQYDTADGTDTSGTGYTAESGTLTFAPGTTSQNITVPVFGYSGGASSETFFVNLSNPTNATLTTAQGTGTAIGNFEPSSLSGNVFTDFNNNGTLDKSNGEMPLQNMAVELTGTDVLGIPVDTFAATDSSGAYSFTNLKPGVYTIKELPNQVYVNGTRTTESSSAFVTGEAIVGSQGGTASGGTQIAVTIPAAGGVTGTGNNFTESNFTPAFINERMFLAKESPSSTSFDVSTLYTTGSSSSSVTPSAQVQSTSPSASTAASTSTISARSALAGSSSASAQSAATDAAVGSTNDWLY